VRSATIIPTEWIELTGKSCDCTIMMKACPLAPLHFFLELQMFVAQFSIYVVVLVVLAHSTHLWVFCTVKKQFARPLCKDALQRYWKDRTAGGDSGQSAQNRVSLLDCGFSARLVPILLFSFPELDDACIGLE
jgi:hypothetical protein